MKRNLRFWEKVVWVICVAVYIIIFIQQTLFAPLSPTDIIIVSLTPLLVAMFGITLGKLLSNHNLAGNSVSVVSTSNAITSPTPTPNCFSNCVPISKSNHTRV